MAVFLAHIFLLLVLAGAGAAGLVQEECAPARCGDSGPAIRFPFWLKKNQPDNCGYPGFELSCTRSNNTEFELPFAVRAFTKNVNIVLRIPVKVSVQEIDYKSQVIQFAVLNASCLPKQLQADINSSSVTSSPFEYIVDPNEYGFTLFNCSSNYTKKNSNYGYMISCLSSHNYDVYALGSFYSISDFPLASCVKMYDVSHVPTEFFTGPQDYSYNQAYMHWSKPSCEICESKGKYCRLKNNGNTTDQETQCFDIHPHNPGHDTGIPSLFDHSVAKFFRD